MFLEQVYWHGGSMAGVAAMRLPDQLRQSPDGLVERVPDGLVEQSLGSHAARVSGGQVAQSLGSHAARVSGGQVEQSLGSHAARAPSDQTAQRLATAQRVLKLAEQATGSRPVGAFTGLLGRQAAAGVEEHPQDAPRLRLVSSMGSEANQCTLLELRLTARALLGPGQVAQVSGSTSALFAVAAGVWGPEDWGVIAGLPEAGYLAAAQAGVRLERCVVVPDLGEEPLRALAGLIDAFGVVVLGPSLPAVAPADRRRLEARLRHRQGCLVTGASWGGAQLNLTVNQVAHQPLGQGREVLSPGLWQVRWSGPLARTNGAPVGRFPDQPTVEVTGVLAGNGVAPSRTGAVEPATGPLARTGWLGRSAGGVPASCLAGVGP